MKRSIVVILLAGMTGLVSIAAVSAEGAQEQGRYAPPASRMNQYAEGEAVSLTGTVEVTVEGVTLLAEDGGEYELMYPRSAAAGMDVESGDTITVAGYLVPGPRWEGEDDEQFLRISQVTIDGEEYDLAAASRPGYGPGSGPQGDVYGRGKGSQSDASGRGKGPQSDASGPGKAHQGDTYGPGNGRPNSGKPGTGNREPGRQDSRTSRR